LRLEIGQPIRKLGVDQGEFTNPTGTGKVHYFTGNGATLAGGSPEQRRSGTTRRC